MAETAITDHKLKRLVDIKPTEDCISSTIKHHLIIQDEYLASVKKPMILFSVFFFPLFLIAGVDLERASEDRSSAGIPDASLHGAGGDHQQAGCRNGHTQWFGFSAASSRPRFPLGVGWQRYKSPVHCFMPADDLGQKCWNRLKGNPCLQVWLCVQWRCWQGSHRLQRPWGRARGYQDLQGLPCGQQGDAIRAGFPHVLHVGCYRPLLKKAVSTS